MEPIDIFLVPTHQVLLERGGDFALQGFDWVCSFVFCFLKIAWTAAATTAKGNSFKLYTYVKDILLSKTST